MATEVSKFYTTREIADKAIEIAKSDPLILHPMADRVFLNPPVCEMVSSSAEARIGRKSLLSVEDDIDEDEEYFAMCSRIENEVRVFIDTKRKWWRLR